MAGRKPNLDPLNFLIKEYSYTKKEVIELQIRITTYFIEHGGEEKINFSSFKRNIEEEFNLSLGLLRDVRNDVIRNSLKENKETITNLAKLFHIKKPAISYIWKMKYNITVYELRRKIKEQTKQ